MQKTDIVDWLKTEFGTITLATADDTLIQIIDNAIRYWNTHSAYKQVRMVDLSAIQISGENLGKADGTTLAFILQSKYFPIKPSTISIVTQIGDNVITITDDGLGNLTDSTSVVQGTVNYVSGQITLTFNSGNPPNKDAMFSLAYQFSTPASGHMLPIGKEFKLVVAVYPSKDTVPQLLWQDNSWWGLFGLPIFNTMTSDFIMLQESFRNYQAYIGTDFRWTFVASEDPDQFSQVMFNNLPSTTTRVCVVGSKRILEDEDIKGQHILDWLLYYCKALLKMCEGNLLRKGSIVGIQNDGQTLFDEGKDEKEELEKRLAIEGRWLVLAQRF